MQPTKDKTCKERIRSRWASRRAAFKVFMQDTEGNEDLGSFYDYGLCFDYVPAGTFSDQDRGYWRFQLSWGGPSDELRFFGDPDGRIYCVEYWFLDWYDGAHINVTDEPCVRWLIDWFSDVGSFESARKAA